MTKKMITLAALMLLALGLQAQSLNGNWSMAQEWMTELNKEIDNSSGTIDRFGMSFTDKEAKVVMMLSVESDGTSMIFSLGIPGTYTRSGNSVKCKYDAQKLEINIRDLKSDDKDIKEMLSEPDTRDMLMNMMNTMMQNELKKNGTDFTEMVELFEEFEIKSLTSSKLEIGLKDNDVNVTFDRVTNF